MKYRNTDPMLRWRWPDLFAAIANRPQDDRPPDLGRPLRRLPPTAPWGGGGSAVVEAGLQLVNVVVGNGDGLAGEQRLAARGTLGANPRRRGDRAVQGAGGSDPAPTPHTVAGSVQHWGGGVTFQVCWSQQTPGGGGLPIRGSKKELTCAWPWCKYTNSVSSFFF